MFTLSDKAKAIVAAVITAASTVALTLGADPTLVGAVTVFLTTIGVYSVSNA